MYMKHGRHGIIYVKIKIRVFLLPIYLHKVWDCSEENVENTKKVISDFNWNKAFENPFIDEEVALLNEILSNIF